MAKQKGLGFIVPEGRKPNSKASEEFVKQLGHYPQYHGTLYLRDFINPERLQTKIDLSVRALKGHKFDALAFMGLSGALIGPPVAMRIGKPFLAIRKPNEDTHSGWEVEGDYAAESYIIIDDFQETGQTIQSIRDQIRAVMPNAKYEGFLAAKWLTDARVGGYEKRKQLFPLE